MAYSVTGGGSYCSGGIGVATGLAGSDTGVTYSMYRGGTTLIITHPGTGAAVSFGIRSAVGTFTIIGTKNTNGCTTSMTGSAVVSITPSPNLYSITGGGSYCSGGAGVHVGLSSSDVNVNYQLLNGTVLVGSALPGTGAALDYGLQTAAGTYYYVIGTSTVTGCTVSSANTSVTINPLPFLFTVTGGGSYCAGGSGVPVGLSSTVTSTNYQLYLSGSPVGSAVAGTGTTIGFGSQTTAGTTYTVGAVNTITGCVGNMSGSASVSINPLPTAYVVTGGGSYCTGGTGVHVGLSNSLSGVNYQLYIGGIPVGTAVSGTGAGR